MVSPTTIKVPRARSLLGIKFDPRWSRSVVNHRCTRAFAHSMPLARGVRDRLATVSVASSLASKQPANRVQRWREEMWRPATDFPSPECSLRLLTILGCARGASMCNSGAQTLFDLNEYRRVAYPGFTSNVGLDGCAVPCTASVGRRRRY